MEEKQDLLNSDLLNTGVYISENSARSLVEITKWSKFIGISGMIVSGILVVMAFIFGGRIEEALSQGITGMGTAGFVALLIMFLFAVVYFTMSLFLFRFATQGQSALASFDKFELTRAIKNLKNVYMIAAIVTTVYILYNIYKTFSL